MRDHRGWHRLVGLLRLRDHLEVHGRRLSCDRLHLRIRLLRGADRLVEGTAVEQAAISQWGISQESVKIRSKVGQESVKSQSSASQESVKIQ